MSNNRFAQIKDQFQSQPAKLVSSSYQRGTASLRSTKKRNAIPWHFIPLLERRSWNI